MVKLKERPYILTDGTINIESWLSTIVEKYSAKHTQLIRRACLLSQLSGADKATATNVSCLQQGLAMAEILLDLQLDAETIAAALVYSSVQFAELSLEDVEEHLGKHCTKLLRGVDQMEAMRSLHSQHHSQIENVRKMLLAMVDDVRVVLIKLAERVYLLRAATLFPEIQQQQLAKDTLNIYAPLANRLGVGQIKWELEDRAFHFLYPTTYKKIAQQLHQTRIERENYINQIITLLKKQLSAANITQFEVTGRAKHIYSIYRKMERKKIHYDEIYDISAVRVLVPTIDDCYTVLGIIQNNWEQIQQEFDDYIATPKANGYQSIHTAVIGPENHNIEIQIRTFTMHHQNELGIAAHWKYKEGAAQNSSYEAKIAWLRQVLEWKKELSSLDSPLSLNSTQQFNDRVYVFTPTGDIIDLPQGATPLDFAYYIHSEIGHRCRGAKINNTIVPLTYTLKTGNQVEILTTKNAKPSRDWLNLHLGYLKTSRARAKVHHWFKQLDFDEHLAEGKAMLEREIKRLELPKLDFNKIAEQLKYKTSDEMLAALGCSDLKISQLLNLIQEPTTTTQEDFISHLTQQRASKTVNTNTSIFVQGVGNLLTHIAGCCKPLPGDPIIGWVTQGRGIGIHRQDCPNILQINSIHKEKLIEVSWGDKHKQIYHTNIFIEAYDRPGLIRDISSILANEKINLITINTKLDKNEHIARMSLGIETSGLAMVSKVLDKIKQLPNIIVAKRLLH
ncbi:MAG: GTP pyrophosphokinase [Legionellaceae bacterium]